MELQNNPPVDRRRVLVVALLGFAAVAWSSSAAAAAGPLAQRLARALVSSNRSGALAVDLSSGQVVFSRNADGSLAPASNEKLPVTYAALSQLGPDYRIETDVLGQGFLDGTTWRGSLVLQGHGDPTLSAWQLAVLARQVRSGGIRRVTGPILGANHHRLLVAGYQSAGDVGMKRRVAPDVTRHLAAVDPDLSAVVDGTEVQ